MAITPFDRFLTLGLPVALLILNTINLFHSFQTYFRYTCFIQNSWISVNSESRRKVNLRMLAQAVLCLFGFLQCRI